MEVGLSGVWMSAAAGAEDVKTTLFRVMSKQIQEMIPQNSGRFLASFAFGGASNSFFPVPLESPLRAIARDDGSVTLMLSPRSTRIVSADLARCSLAVAEVTTMWGCFLLVRTSRTNGILQASPLKRSGSFLKNGRYNVVI